MAQSQKMRTKTIQIVRKLEDGFQLTQDRYGNYKFNTRHGDAYRLKFQPTVIRIEKLGFGNRWMLVESVRKMSDEHTTKMFNWLSTKDIDY